VGKRYVVAVEVEPLDEGGYLAVCTSIPGCHAEGVSVAEAIQNVQGVAQAMLEFRLEKGLGLPDGLQEAQAGPTEVRAQVVVPVG